MSWNKLKWFVFTTLFLLLLLFGVVSLLFPALAAYAPPTASSFSTTITNVAASAIQLQGSDPDGTALTFAIASNPASGGTLNNLNANTGAVVFTPTSGFTGTTTFTYTVTSGGETSAAATVTVTVTNQRTRVIDKLLHPDGTPRQGMVTFILARPDAPAVGPTSVIPVSSSVTAQLDASGQFDVQLIPSTGLSPESYYQVWFADKTTLRREPLGVFAIPASTVSITLSGRKVTDTNKAARYLFASTAQVEALTNALANGAANYGAHPVIGAGHNDTVNTGISTGALLMRNADSKWQGLASGTGFLKAAGGLPSYAALTSVDLPNSIDYKTLTSPIIAGTVQSNINVGGTVTATQFIGDGSLLTGIVSGGGGGGTLSITRPFTTTIPFDYLASNLGSAQVAAGMVFTKTTASQQPGFGAFVRLSGNGTNSPTFSGFKEAGSSNAFDTRANYLNVIQFWFDGTDHWYNIFQPLNGVAIDSFPPTLVSATIGAFAADKIVLTYSESLDATSIPAINNFVPSGGRSVTSVVIAGSTVTLTVNSAYTSGIVTLSYTPAAAPIRDAAANNAAALTNQAVTNNAGSLIDLTFTQALTGFTTAGTTYTATTTANSGLADQKAAASADFAFQMRLTAADAASGMFGLNTSATNEQYNNWEYYAWTAGGTIYRSPGANNTGVAWANGDYLRWFRLAGVLKLQKSSDGTSWTDIHTYGTDNAQFFFNIQQLNGVNKIYEPKGIGVVAR